MGFTGKDDIFDLNWVNSVSQFLDKFSGIGWVLELDCVIPRSLRIDECDMLFQEEGGETEQQGRREGAIRLCSTSRVIS